MLFVNDESLVSMLIVFAGLPGTGKTTIARKLCQATGAVHMRVDTVEQAMVRAEVAQHPVGEIGYVVSYAVAEDNLRLGRVVVADSVNPVPVTRQAWRDVAERTGSDIREIEVICSDEVEHRRRVEARQSGVDSDSNYPAWSDVLRRTYTAWAGDRHVLDTAGRSSDDCVREVREQILP